MKIVSMPSASGDGEFFKPSEETADFYLIEVTEFEPQKQTKYGPKDWVHANLHSSKDGQWTDRGKVIFGNSAIVRTLKDLVDQAVVGVLGQVPTDKGNPAWVLNNASPKQIEEAVKYAESLGSKPDEAPDPFDGEEEPPPF